ncbi:MAG: FAD-dependent oxidoreductase [Eubacteriales bacterium]|nr:FAD-dependent oxidoreductase [Eubacteriales bacterium]
MIRVDNLSMPLYHTIEELIKKAEKKAGVTAASYKIIRKAVDARKGTVRFVYSVIINPDEEKKRIIPTGDTSLNAPPVIVGMGPAGLFAAYYLAEYGYKPIVIERGSDVDNRCKKTELFYRENILDTECNVQFGEGGAGTFSDGKLTTRVNDERCGEVLKIFTEHGAPEEILYLGKPHIGTDNLVNVVKSMREHIINKGGKVFFDEKAEAVITTGDRAVGIKTSQKMIDSEHIIFAIGHSAEDTYQSLALSGVEMRAKPFAVGVRIEHRQENINKAMYHDFAGHPALGSADYRLAEKHNGRGCFSFCMCPGGHVIASTSDEGRTVTNGMSLYARDGENANSALLVGVGPEEYGSGVFAGITFRKQMEINAYKLAGDYRGPVQLLGDLINNQKSTKIGNVVPSYTNDYVLTDLNGCLPSFIKDTICGCMSAFEKRINGFSSADAVLTGVETRSSAPVTIPRGEDGQSVSIKGIYPCGEGAGYAGGIVSAAVDGIKMAEQIITRYKPLG